MKKTVNYLDDLGAETPSVLQEIAVMPGIGETTTRGGKPKAMIGALRKSKHVPFTGTHEHLAKMPPWRGGPTADEIIREERDSRPLLCILIAPSS